MSKEPKRNVYVGHRYVPKVMGEWDKSQTYEGLSIVTNEGTSYTSKKRVPIGIDIKNEEYWVVTGNYNAQIEEYRKDVREVEKDVREVEKEVGKKSDQSYVDNLNEKVTTQLAQTENEVEHIKHRFTKVQNTDGAITHMINTGLTYAERDNEFVYGNELVLNSSNPNNRGAKNENGKWELDCSSFINALLQDIPFDKSAYVHGGVNYPSSRGYKFSSEDSASGGRLLAHDIGKYAYDRGWTFEPNDDYSNVQVGDLLFYQNSDVEGFWREISHINVVTDIQVNKELSDTVRITLLECPAQDQVAGRRTTNQDELKNMKCGLVARFPLPDVSLTPISIGREDTKTVEVDDFSTSLGSKVELKESTMYTIEFDYSVDNPESFPHLQHYVDGNLTQIYSFFNLRPIGEGKYKLRHHFWFDRGHKKDQSPIMLYASERGYRTATFENIRLYEGIVSGGKTPHLALEKIDNVSNARGEAVKLPDGTMIQTHLISQHEYNINNAVNGVYKDTNEWVYPVEFVDPPFVTVSTTGSVWGDLSTTPSPTKCTFNVFSATETTLKLNAFLIAIGRWK